MAKSSGLGWSTCSVDDSSGTVRAIVNDVTSLNYSTPRGVQDITGIDKSARETLLLLADVSGSLSGVFNPTANASHDVFKTIPSTSVARTITLTVSAKTLAFEAHLTDYPLSRSDSGELTWAVPFVLADGTTPAWTG